jgi:hypothetical protein
MALASALTYVFGVGKVEQVIFKKRVDMAC